MLTTKVYGPPGTGKTSYLLGTVERELATGVAPRDIAYVSFTKAGAHEGRDRALRRFSQYTEEDFPYFSTVHSICFRLLGLTRKQVFTGRALAEFAKAHHYQFSAEVPGLMVQALADFDPVEEADYYEAFAQWQKDTMRWRFEDALAEFQRHHQDLTHDFSPQRLRAYLERRERFKQEHGLWDFADMLIGAWERPFAPEVLVVDEAQDNSPLLFKTLEGWMQRAERVYLSGDPYQAIFSFAGADPELMLNLKADETITLKQSHRCCKAVHDLARAVVQRMRVRYDDDDFLPTAEPGQVAPYTGSLDGGTVFLLARTRWLLDQHYERLMDKGIPFLTRRGRKSPFEKEVGLAAGVLLRLRGGGDVGLAGLHRLACALPQRGNMVKGTRGRLEKMVQEGPGLKVWAETALGLGFAPHLFSPASDPFEPFKAPDDDKRYLRKVLARHGEEALFERPKLVLGTYHSFKGLEADSVVLDLSLTRRPWNNLQQFPDEEHRVFYTGITRARTKVMLVAAESAWGYPLIGAKP